MPSSPRKRPEGKETGNQGRIVENHYTESCMREKDVSSEANRRKRGQSRN